MSKEDVETLMEYCVTNKKFNLLELVIEMYWEKKNIRYTTKRQSDKYTQQDMVLPLEQAQRYNLPLEITEYK